MNKAIPEISIVVPVYNAEQYLRQCLDSALGQTLRQIECLCVDDASTDASPEILADYAAGDSRLRLITYSRNKSSSQARKDAVLASRGRYIMFLDADDYLEPSACERLLKQIKEQDVEILQFASEPLNIGRVSEARIENMRRYLTPASICLSGKEIVRSCFAKKKFGFTLWNKIYDAGLCRRAFAALPDGILPAGQDLLAFFVVAFFARSYAGSTDPTIFHHYRFGSGLTGHDQITLERLETFCTQAKVAEAVHNFIVEQDALHEFEKENRQIRHDLFFECFWNWRRNLSPSDREAGFELLLKYWEISDLVRVLAPADQLFDAPQDLPHYLELPTWRDHLRLKAELADMQSSWSWRLGSALLFLPRRLHDRLRRQGHGKRG